MMFNRIARRSQRDDWFPRSARHVLIGLALIAGCQAAPEEGDDLWRPRALTGDATELPDGREVITRMTEFLRGHDQLAFEALASYEAVQESGQKLHFDMLQRMAVRWPDRLFWVTLHDDATSDSAWFDRGDFTLLKQPANVWGQVDLPPTIAEGVDRLVNEYDLDVPFSDILSSDPRELWLGEDVLALEYVGEAWVEGFWTDHIAIRKPGVDMEIWVRQGDEPFPMRVHIIYTEDDGAPAFSARFLKWATSLPEGALPEFSPPPGAERVEVVPVRD